MSLAGGTLRYKLDAALTVLRHLVWRRILRRPMAYDQNNLFAKILRGELPAYKVYEDDRAFAFLDIMPRAPGHTLVLPKSPARNIFDVDAEDLAHVAKVAQKIAKAALKAFDADGITLQQFNEPAGGQVVFHLHVHVIPRRDGVALKPPASEKEKPEVLQQQADKLKAALADGE
jgi:histidine triad (HIT) family protein